MEGNGTFYYKDGKGKFQNVSAHAPVRERPAEKMKVTTL